MNNNTKNQIQKETNLDPKFVDKFSDHLTDTSKMISFSEANEWLGYKHKQTVLRLLTNTKYNFIEGTDFKIEKMDSNGGRPIDEIYMTIDTVKCICLMSPTEQSQKFRKYYIEMEKMF